MTMGYLITGLLSGSLPRSTFEFLSNVRVMVYAPEKNDLDAEQQTTTGKEELCTLEAPDQVLDKNRLLGEGITDREGRYDIVLADTYNRGRIGLYAEITEVPKQKINLEKSVYCLLKVVQPFWRKQEAHHQFHLNFRFPYDFWSGIRSRFDAWMIFGYVRMSRGLSKLEGLTVTAYDVDWVKDDLLGRATTDASGYFRIDYNSADFKQTFLSPLVNLETPLTALTGPGVYFKITDPGGETIYEEPSKVGKTSQRKNISHCFYVELKVDSKTSS